MPRNAACADCPLSATVQTPCVWGHGPEHAEIMLVGEAPGADEDEQGTPFIGSAGRLLNQLLQRAGLAREDIYVSNVVRCRPPGNRTPTTKEIRACSHYLAEEIATVQPKLIIGLGGTAVKALSTTKAIKDARGKQLEASPLITGTHATVMGTFHPAFYFKNHSKAVLDHIEEDLRLAAASLHGDAQAAKLPPRKDTLVLPNANGEGFLDAVAALERLRDHTTALAVDCEWTAPKEGMAWSWTPGAELYSISLSGVIDGVLETVALAWPQPSDGLLNTLLRSLLTAKRIVCHNAMADLIWIAGGLKIQSNLFADTMVLSYLLDETTNHSLEYLGTSLCGIPAWKRPLWAQRPESDDEWLQLLKYNADDTYATICVYKALLAQVRALSDEKQQALLRLHNKLYVPTIPLYVEMTLNGVGIDAGELARALFEQTDLKIDAELALGQILGISAEKAALIPPSPPKSLEALHSKGVMVASTGRPVIEPLSDQYPVIDAILNVRRKNKLITTYIRPWLGLLERQGDNRLHSVYKPLGTRTGRASAEMEGKGNGGSIHQMPRNVDATGEASFKVRDMVIPADGYVIVGGDYSQIELRVAAWIAHERTMIDLYRRGKDLHINTAAMVAGIPAAKVTKEQRQRGKIINFAFLYGMQSEKFITYAWILYRQRYGLEEARRMRLTYFKLYKDLSRWHAKCASAAANEQFVTSPLGRIYRDITTPQDAANFPVQGTAGMLLNLTMTYFDELLRKEKLRQFVRPILAVHDSLACEVVERYADDVKPLMQEAFRNPPTERLGVSLSSIPVPFIGDVGIGRQWSTLK